VSSKKPGTPTPGGLSRQEANMGTRRIFDKVTESGMDTIMSGLDKWSRVLAWAAVTAAIFFILLPAVAAVWMR